jgi:hypothetical protein
MKAIKQSCFFRGCVIPFVFLLCLYFLISFVAVTLPYHMAYNKWQTSKPLNYSVSVSSDWGNYDHEETVRNGTVFRTTATNSTEPLIEVLFDAVERCNFQLLGFLFCQVTYDPTYGYPQTLIEFPDFDLGRTTEVSKFTLEQ